MMFGVPKRVGLGLLACALIGSVAPSCVEEQEQASLPPLWVGSVGPTPLLPGSQLTVLGGGFVDSQVALISATIEGQVGTRPVDVTVVPERVDDATLVIPIIGNLRSALIEPGQVLSATLSLTRTRIDGAGVDGATIPLNVPTELALAPSLFTVTPTAVFAGDQVALTTVGALHPTEGRTLLEFNGTLAAEAPPEEVEITGVRVVALPVDPLSRESANFQVNARPFGFRAGVFSGSITPLNQHLEGAEILGAPMDPGPMVMGRSRVDALDPSVASRGQRVLVRGLGLLGPSTSDSHGTILLLEGLFVPDRGETDTWTGDDIQALFLEAGSELNTLAFTLRALAAPGGLAPGLGAESGEFSGTVTPYLFSPDAAALGEPTEISFQVASPVQVVQLRFLPVFQDALSAFGLEAERDAVVARIFEVLGRDYAGISIRFQPTTPTDHEEYAVVEVGSVDPNGTGLFGLDNTAGKDVGNLRFDDIIGGFNADTRARGYAAYGGIFVEELLRFSPTLSDNPLASPRFDDVFSGVVPSLGGTPAQPGEGGSDSPRGLSIQDAVRVLGNLAGHTISHEVGHSLGLTAIDGQFHNSGDNPGWIMDAGPFRPFEERAEVDGQGPGVFSPGNREYLKSILPP